MAFSLRKMFSNISYFSKSGDNSSPTDDIAEDNTLNRRHNTIHSHEEQSRNIAFHTEPDSTSINLNFAHSLKLPESVRNFTAKKGSLSDTDLVSLREAKKSCRSKNKNLKLDIMKASRSMTDSISRSDNIENTPKHILLDCRSADMFSEKFRKLDFSRSFEFDVEAESSDENFDIESLSECSDTDETDKNEIKMCRKVDENDPNDQFIPSVTPESFGDVEFDRNEEERISLLLNYQMKFEKMECVLSKLLSEFQFHIEVSKIFNSRSAVNTLCGTHISNLPKSFGQVKYMDNVTGDCPTGAWNVIIEKEDLAAKTKLRKQLTSLRNIIDNFTSNHLRTQHRYVKKPAKKTISFNLPKGRQYHKTTRATYKKKIKHFDFPDLRDALLNLFNDNQGDHDAICQCHCHCHDTSNVTDSGLTKDNTNQSITSSIGNFTLDSTTLSAYSESLDLIISYNSFQDTSLMNTLLLKPAVDRITFYVQAHSIQLKSESVDMYESKSSISFYCPACEAIEVDENGLLNHILSQKHCEKLHFVYKTAYIKKCVVAGKEIQPSTILNPMRMYRDDNKIVCFGDGVFACSLCFENMIVGESFLMAHCSEPNHVERRQKLDDFFD